MREILDDFKDIIRAIELASTTERYDFQFLKIRVRLIDGSSLRIWEKRSGESLQRYSYYWLNELDNQIIGWDNAPHHPDIETFPHHKHTGGKTLPSDDKLIDVLNYIANRLR